MHVTLAARKLAQHEADHLLSNEDWMEMAQLERGATQGTGDKGQFSNVEGHYTDGERLAESSTARSMGDGDELPLANGTRGDRVEYKVYKIRWFGLTQLILLNIVVSWDVSFSNEHLYDISIS